MVTGGGWRSDAPPVNRVVEVWYVNTVILAVWDGQGWRTSEGMALRDVSHWRVSRA
jgi:hypothetical protein